MVKKILRLFITTIISLSLVGCGIPGILAEIPEAYQRNWYKREPYYVIENLQMDAPDGNTYHLIGVKIKIKDLPYYQKEQQRGYASTISGPYPPE